MFKYQNNVTGEVSLDSAQFSIWSRRRHGDVSILTKVLGGAWIEYSRRIW